MREAVIVSAARTPVGRCRGVLAPVPAADLGALAVKTAVERAGIDPASVDDVIFGNLFNNEIANMAHYVGLKAGLPITVPGVTVDRQCASGLNAAAFAAMMIQAGYADTVVAGGVESDSTRAYVCPKATQPYQVFAPKWIDTFLTAPDPMQASMGITAENVAKKYGFTREQLDAFAVESHRKASEAWKNGVFDSQIVPVVIKGKKGDTVITKDECVRDDCSMESLAKLKPAFIPDGMVTAGNSSPMSDGSGAVVMMAKEKALAEGLKPLAKFVDFCSAGVDPLYMGTGPIAACRKLFERNGLTWDDIDLIELNEAFSSQSLACIQDLEMPMEKVNVNGGALALGHPLAGTGGILLTKMVYELERRNLRTGLITFCIGGGQGSAALIERVI